MNLNFSKVLVTGGAGFIGSHLVDALVASGCAVTVLDNLSSGNLDNLEPVMDRIDFVQGDIRDLALLQQVCREKEAVFHQAAVVSVTKTVEDPVGSNQVNDVGTLHVLEAARCNDVRKVVLASSSAVYGDDPQLPKTESMPARPLSPYAVQKRTNEHHAMLYHRLYGLDTTCLRYFNVFGPRQDPSSPYSGVISIFMTCAASGKKPTIYGDGRQTRDFVFVQDVVHANLLAAASDQTAGHLFNIGSSVSTEIHALWRAIADMAGCIENPVFAAPRAGDIVHSLAGIMRARQQLGFAPEISLAQGLRSTYSWYRDKR